MLCRLCVRSLLSLCARVSIALAAYALACRIVLSACRVLVIGPG